MSKKVLQAACKKAFEQADLDKSGQIDINELFIAILLVYDRVNYYSPVYVQIPTKVQVQNLMKKFDREQDGQLALEEFEDVVKALFAFDAGQWKQSLWYRTGYSIFVKIALVPFLTYCLIQLLSGYFPLMKSLSPAVIAGVMEVAIKLLVSDNFFF